VFSEINGGWRREYSPARNILWILTVTRTVRFSNLEHRTNRTTVLSCNAFQTNVILSAVVRVGMSRE